jgi:signal transduction histidine kinase
MYPRLRSAARYASRHWRLCAFVLLGAAAAAAVGYLTAQNPNASPAHVAVPLRVAIVLTLVAVGAYAQTSTGQARVGVALVGAGLFSSLWLLNGAREPILFSLGLLLTGLAPAVFAYVVLVYPSGRLRSEGQRRLLLCSAAAISALWTFLVMTHAHPPVKTPLLHCGEHCPQNLFFAGSTGSGVASVATAGLWVGWIALACGTPLLLFAGSRRRVEPVRRSLVPIEVVAVASAVLWVGFGASQIVGARAAGALGSAYVETALAVPLAILAGLFVERLTIGRALATFATGLAAHPDTAPEWLLARALKDPSLRIAYYQPSLGGYIDSAGHPVRAPEGDERRAVARIGEHGAPVAAITYDAGLSDQAAFVEAAGAVAVMRVEAARLEADLTEANGQLAASRRRLVEAADNERQRIERDLHDGVQQYVLGLRLRLDLASEAIPADPARGEQMLSAIGNQLDELLAVLRSFAAGIYPSILTERGLKDALESALRHLGCPVSLHTFGLRRYPEDVEVALYFCCVEAIQNIVKHAGPEPDPRVRMWHVAETLAFDVRDSGVGFDASEQPAAHGLINMHDRLEAIGGTLWVGSQPGRGTWVRGRVPLG